jgi:hypothetical protein
MIVEYNPLTAQVQSRKVALGELRATTADLRSRLGWYDAFDPSGAAGLGEIEARTVTRLNVQLLELDTALAIAKERAERVRPATLSGWNPSYWFSEARSTARRELAQCIAECGRSEANIRRYVGERDRASEAIAGAQESLKMYSTFDRGAAAASLVGLDAEIERLGLDLAMWEAREKALGIELEVPLREFLDLRRQLDGLKLDLDTAKRLERELGAARDGVALRRIHDECERRFNTGSPRAVIKRTGPAIRSLERNTNKLERRLRDIARRGSLDVQMLIIDGSNLCYEDGRLIGLYALRAVCDRLPDGLDTIVVFDASIRRKLGVNDDTLRAQLPGVRVHVVASKAGADATILDAAQNPNSFILSNDQFADFPDKPAVQDGRLIRHEILNRRVLIEDLFIDIGYSNGGS